MLYENYKLLAPNGKVSNLNASQYNLVRNKKFKDWFGDWENDTVNSSKMLDENGEPKIMYHGSSIEKEEFDNRDGYIFFSTLKSEATKYSSNYKYFFINARNIFDVRNLTNKEITDVKNLLDDDIRKKYLDAIANVYEEELYLEYEEKMYSDVNFIYELLTKDYFNWVILETEKIQNYITSNNYDSFITLEPTYNPYDSYNLYANKDELNIAVYNTDNIYTIKL